MITRKLRFSVLQLTETELVNVPLKKSPWENCSSKKRSMKKVPEKYIFLRFDLTGNAYSAGDNFHFSINLIQIQKHVNKKECRLHGVLHTKDGGLKNNKRS